MAMSFGLLLPGVQGVVQWCRGSRPGVVGGESNQLPPPSPPTSGEFGTLVQVMKVEQKKRLDLMTSNNVCYFNKCLL